MGRPKKFHNPKNTTVTFESQERYDLEVVAAKDGKSVSEFLRDLVLPLLPGGRRKQKRKPNTRSQS